MGYYLYNGIKLPELPASAYPYAMITEEMVGYCVYFIPVTLVKYGTHGVTVPQGGESVTSEKWRFDQSNGCWVSTDGYTLNEDRQIGWKVLWANFDILYLDGSLYLAASDPVPVRSPSAMMLGYQAGQAVRGMRK